VFGVSNTGGGFTANGDGSGIGVVGRSASGSGVTGEATTGFGVRGISNTIVTTTNGLGSGIGVQGRSGSGFGVKGEADTGIGVQGDSQGGVGLRGVSNTFVGLVGISNTSIGLYGYNTTPDVPAFYAENLAPSGNRVAGLFNGHVTVQGNFMVTGAKAAAVTMPDGSLAMMYCQESPEPFFEDFGRAQLVGGFARVALEPRFASLVRLDGYMVFAMPEGECRGLAVVRRDAQGFDVRELQGGTSTLPFTYRLVAQRRDIAGGRLAPIDPRAVVAAAGVSRAMAGHSPFTPGASGPASPVPSMPPLAPAPAPGPVFPASGGPSSDGAPRTGG
jgi:hypothetical protein